MRRRQPELEPRCRDRGEEVWRSRQQALCRCCAAGEGEHRTEQLVQVAKLFLRLRVALRRGLRRAGVPVLVGERRVLREQHGDYEKNAP